MGFFSIGIESWAAWATHFENLPRQQIAAGCGNLTISQEFNLRPASIQPMLLRRLSPLGRTALWCAEQVLDSEALPHSACVFASQHGEVARTMDILNGYFRTGEVSPTSFSLSVHNAISGIYSIANGFRRNITAIAAGDDSLMMALLESAAILRSDAVERVLCVVYDQAIPEELNCYQSGPDCGFAIALLLDKRSTHQIAISDKPASSSGSVHQFYGLISYLLGDGAQQEIASHMRCWNIRTYQGDI